MDHSGDSLSFVAFGVGEWLHDGWSHSYPAGHSHRRGAGPGHSRPKALVVIWALAGEGKVLGKEVVGKSSKILSKLYTFSRKGIEPNYGGFVKSRFLPPFRHSRESGNPVKSSSSGLPPARE